MGLLLNFTSMSKAFEYKITKYTPSEYYIHLFNQLGKDGWELMRLEDTEWGKKAIFKREIETVADKDV